MLFCRGLYITILDAGHVLDVLCNWPQKDIKVRLIDAQSDTDYKYLAFII